MNAEAMRLHGAALAAYFDGEPGAEIRIRREDGLEVRLPASYFFREQREFTPIERAALERCSGRVLDAGAGTGLHSLVLQSRGLAVTAIDISPDAVEVMRRRGVADARCGDVYAFDEGPFDTLLLLGHGIGMAETLAGLDRFLCHALRLVTPGGRILLDSLDVRLTRDPAHLAYHAANRAAGRYAGETVIQVGYGDAMGPKCGWLHVDPETLEERAARSGWACRAVLTQESGEYLAELVLSRRR